MEEYEQRYDAREEEGGREGGGDDRRRKSDAQTDGFEDRSELLRGARSASSRVGKES